MVDDALGDLIATLGSIDDDEIDWQNVARTTVLIHQAFRYEYPGPIASLRQRLIVVPPDYHDDQRLLTHKLRVTGCDVDTERSEPLSLGLWDVLRTIRKVTDVSDARSDRISAPEVTLDRPRLGG